MRKSILYSTLFASLLTLTGCSDEADIAVSDANKQPIALTVGADAPLSRAVITDGTGKTLEAFDVATDIWMVMQSEYKALSGNNESPSDLDFKGSQTTTNCVTMGTTGDKTGTGLKENVVNFTAANTRYWDDAHARSSALSIWAVAVPNVTGTASKWGSKTAGTWNTTTEDKTISWEVPAAQNAESMKNKDLCFSNNIADYSSASGSDSRMKYGTTTQNKFDQGKLIFYHALTKITVKLVEGEGFDPASSSDFVLDNITLNGFKLSGTFDVAQGEFTTTATDATPITSMSQVSRTAADLTLEALVMPGTDLNSTTLADAISFSLDKNAFKVSAETLKSKLPSGFDKFEAGKNYIFTFTVNKTGIKLTATIAGWNDVTADTFAPKINISEVYGHQASDDECSDLQKGFDFYRSTTVSSGYTDQSTVSYTDGAYTMSPQLYWPNHETHYFFRGVYPTSTTVADSKIAVSNAAYNSATSPSNLMVGYPRKTDGTPDETCKVHTSPVTQGICATEGDIRMNFQYVMSQVEVKLISDPSAVGKEEAAKVVLDENTTVEILNGYKSGSIRLENGTATYAESDKGTYTFAGGTYADRHDIIIPQSISDLKFRITVTDSEGKKDSYEATISEIQVGGNTITSWEPGKKYVYTLNITKTGIKVTATIKDWIEVKNDDPYHIWM